MHDSMLADGQEIENTAYDVMIVDGGGVITSAWAAVKTEPDRTARITGALGGLITSLLTYSSRLRPGARTIVVWDGEDNRRYRRGMHPWYKHGRGTAIDREEVRAAIPIADELLRAAGIATVVLDYHEADDVVATLARKSGGLVLLVSDDKDYYQLVSDRVHLARRSNGGQMVTPKQAADIRQPVGWRYLMIKAIMGDTGDNIKPLRQIGEVKATAIVDAVPHISHIAEHDYDAALEELKRLDPKLIKALVSAGSQLVCPVPLADPEFAKKYYPNVSEESASDDDCLGAALSAVARAYKLVRMCDSLPVEIPEDQQPLGVDAITSAAVRAGISTANLHRLITLSERGE